MKEETEIMSTSDERNVADIRRALLEMKVRQRVAEKAERERIASLEIPVQGNGHV